MIKKLLFAGLLLGLTIPVGATSVTANLTNSGGLSQTGETVSFSEYYDYDTVLNIPTLIKDGITYTSTVEFPDGSATHLTTIKLNQVGIYKVHYTATLNDVNYKENFSFTVKNRNFSFDGDTSYASYEKSDRTYNKEGLFVALKQGETFTYNKVLDLSEAKSAKDIVEAFAAPTNAGSIDFNILYFQFTDVTDPNCTLTVKARASLDGSEFPWTYWQAKGPRQNFTGKEGNQIHTNGDFGTPTTHSFYGYYTKTIFGTENVQPGDRTLKFSYSANDLTAWANGMMITDLDSSAYNVTLWDGFKSGKVIFSMWADGYVNNLAKVTLLKLGGYDLSEVVLEDNEAPVITVDAPSKTPTARVGYQYPIFNATAKDNVTTGVEVKTTVLYRYDSVNDKYINVKNDGKHFEVARQGLYKIIYEATDAVGNIARETVEVSAVDDAMPLFVLPEGELTTTIARGEYYYFPSFKVSGGSGKVVTNYRVTFNNAPVSLGKNYFIPANVGTYKVSFEATDFIGQKEFYSYNLTVTENTGSIFYNEPSLPKYFISDYRYYLPELYATDFSENDALKLADVTITSATGTVTVKAGEYFTPTVENNGEKVTITYSYKEESLTYEIPTIKSYEGIRLALQNYFITDGIEVDTATPNRFGMVATRSGDVSWEFANYLVAEEASLEFSLAGEKSLYDELHFTLTDKNNSDQSVTVAIRKTIDGKVSAYCNGNSLKLDAEFSGESSAMSIAYHKNQVFVNGAYIDVTNYDNGEPFKGFESGYIYFSSKMVGALEGATYYMTRIDNQIISAVAFDFIAPRVYIQGAIGGYFDFGSSYTLPKAVFSDVLDPDLKSTLTFTGPDGEVVTDINGTKLSEVDPGGDYTVKLDSYGQFIISLYSVDSSDNTLVYDFAVGVLEDHTPEIVLTSSYKTNIKLGQNIIVPNFKVNYSGDRENLTTYVTIRSPKGLIVKLPDGTNSYKPANEGVYVVTIYAFDNVGNMDTYQYAVTVTK